MTYLLDSDTFIYFTKGNRGVLKKIQEVGEENLTLSAVSIAELYFGVYHSERSSENLKRLQNFLKEIDIHNFNVSSARVFGRLKNELVRGDVTLDDFDLAIASITIATDSILVTHNTRHFEKIPELVCEDWVS